MQRLIILMAVLFLIGGCAEVESDFEFSVSPESSIVIKAPVSSCFALAKTSAGEFPPKDITANTAQFSSLSFTYDADPAVAKTNLVIAYVEVRFDMGVGNQKVEPIIFAGDDLLYMVRDWASYGEAVVGGPQIKSYNDPDVLYVPAQTIKSNCPLKIGKLPSGAAYTATATVLVEGYLRDTAGNPIKRATARSIINVKFNGD